MTILQDRVSNVISANKPLADDDVLIDYGNLLADELAALQSRPATCYQYATSGVLDASLMPCRNSAVVGVAVWKPMRPVGPGASVVWTAGGGQPPT